MKREKGLLSTPAMSSSLLQSLPKGMTDIWVKLQMTNAFFLLTWFPAREFAQGLGEEAEDAESPQRGLHHFHLPEDLWRGQRVAFLSSRTHRSPGSETWQHHARPRFHPRDHRLRSVMTSDVLLAYRSFQKKQVKPTSSLSILLYFPPCAGSADKAIINVTTGRQARMVEDSASEKCTMPYRAPELFMSDLSPMIDQRTDVWVCNQIFLPPDFFEVPVDFWEM